MPRRPHAPAALGVALVAAALASGFIEPAPEAAGSTSFTLVLSPVSQNPRLIEATDLDGDGVPDLILLSASADLFSQPRVHALLSDGDGSFTENWSRPQPQEFPGGFISQSLAVADLDLDGVDDAATGFTAVEFGMRMGDGAGALPTFQQDALFGGYAGDLGLADFSLDGIPDMAHFTDDIGPYVDWGAGVGDGLFSNSQTGFTAGNPFDHDTLIEQADLDGDGGVDMVLSTAQGIEVSLGTKGVSPAAFLGFTEVWDGATRGLVIADVAGDDAPDLVFARPLEDRIGVLTGNGDGTFVTPPRWFDTGDQPNLLVVTDLDGDGLPDAVAGNASGGTVSVLFGVSPGIFSAQVEIAVGSAPLGVAAADFDDDGDTDVAVALSGSTDIAVLRNQLVPDGTDS